MEDPGALEKAEEIHLIVGTEIGDREALPVNAAKGTAEGNDRLK